MVQKNTYHFNAGITEENILEMVSCSHACELLLMEIDLDLPRLVICWAVQ
jgi:hypothetical protein